MFDRYQDMLVTLELVRNYGFAGAIDKIAEMVDGDIKLLIHFDNDWAKDYIESLKYIREDLDRIREDG